MRGPGFNPINATAYPDALARLFGDEFQFVLQPGAVEVGVVLRGELIITCPVRRLYPGDTLTLTIGDRVWEFRVPRWSLNLRLEQVGRREETR